MEGQNRQLDAFPSTHWSTVADAGWADSESRRSALEKVLARYRGPLIAHLRWRFASDETQAEDWVHGFVEKRILEKELLRLADQAKGKFRTFLLTALDHYVQDELRRMGRTVRHPPHGIVSMEDAEAQSAQIAAPDQEDPFECAWTRTILAESAERLQEFYNTKGRPEFWMLFESGILEPILYETDPPDLEELASKFNFESARQVSNCLITTKRMFRSILAMVVAEYVSNQELVAEEIRQLMDRLNRYQARSQYRP
jgi:DNA-directed RNA polymerase specialized sigma24 family protein